MKCTSRIVLLTFATSLGFACASSTESPDVPVGVYRVSLAIRQNSNKCPASAATDPTPAFERPRFLRVDDGEKETKTFAACAIDSGTCEPIGTLARDASFSPAAWVGESRTAERVDENTCRLRIAYASATLVELSHFESRNRVRFERSFYEALYPKAAPAECRPDDYKGRIACRFEELIEAAP